MESEQKKQICKKILAVLLSIALIGCVIFGTAERAKADILGASLFTALPVSWPVVATVLIACGVGTAVYYATLPPEKKDEIVTEVVNILSARRLTLITEAIVKGYQKQYSQGTGQYVKGVVGSDGRSYLAKPVVDAILDAANSLGMIGGEYSVVNGLVSNALIIEGSSVLDLPRIKPSDLANYITWTWHIEQKQAFVNLTNQLADNDIIYISSVADNYWVYVFKYDDQSNKILTGSYDRNRGEIYCNSNVTSYIYTLYGNGVYSSPSETNRDYFKGSVGTGKNHDAINSCNIGNYDIVSGGVPVGELGQSIDQDGAWTHPGGDYVIDNYGDATPISTNPAITGSDVVTSSWDGSVQFPQSITLPDVIAVPEGITVPATQTEAIEGDAEDTEPIAVPSPITADYEAFLVPDWIKRRFPFCIPFDISRAIKGMSDSKNLVIDFTVTISGCPLHVYQDFSDFDEMFAKVRSGVFIMYGIFLFFVTKDMIKW